MQDARYIAVVPAYNEAETVGSVVNSIRVHAPRFDVLVIDDGSTDGTGDVARALGARVVRPPFNLGIGGAMQCGFVFAAEHDYDYVVQVDADGQHSAEEIDKLLGAMRADPTIDMVCGSRFLTKEHSYPAPISRRTGIHLFAFLLSRIIGQRVSDPTSGFRLYNRRGIALFARDYPHDYQPATSESAAALNSKKAVQEYIVKGGDTLSKIAEQFLGNGAKWEKVYEANRDSV